ALAAYFFHRVDRGGDERIADPFQKISFQGDESERDHRAGGDTGPIGDQSIFPNRSLSFRIPAPYLGYRAHAACMDTWLFSLHLHPVCYPLFLSQGQVVLVPARSTSFGDTHEHHDRLA